VVLLQDHDDVFDRRRRASEPLTLALAPGIPARATVVTIASTGTANLHRRLPPRASRVKSLIIEQPPVVDIDRAGMTAVPAACDLSPPSSR
jgi:hypothetical protein